MSNEHGDVPPPPPPPRDVPPPPPPGADSREAPRRFKLRTAIASAASVIALLAIAIPFFLSGNGTDSSKDTLAAAPAEVVREQAPESEATGADLIESDDDLIVAMGSGATLGEIVKESKGMVAVEQLFWEVPVSVDLTDFPFSEAGSDEVYTCQPDQVEWLRTQGARTSYASSNWLVDVRNEASSGGAMSLTNFRFEGQHVRSEPTIHVNCGWGGVGDGPPPQQVLLFPDGSAAVNGEYMDFSDETGSGARPVGEVATFNVQPGEIERIWFALYAGQEFLEYGEELHGRLVADLVGEETETVVVLEEREFVAFPVGGYALSLAERAWCRYPDSPFELESECDLAEAHHLLLEAAESVGW